MIDPHLQDLQRKYPPRKLPKGTLVTNAAGWHGLIVDRPKKWPQWKPLEFKDGTHTQYWERPGSEDKAHEAAMMLAWALQITGISTAVKLLG